MWFWYLSTQFTCIYSVSTFTDSNTVYHSKGLDLIKADMPTFLGMVLALSLFSAVICLVLKIFARARYARTRRYANAAIPPPLTVSGKKHDNGYYAGHSVFSCYLDDSVATIYILSPKNTFLKVQCDYDTSTFFFNIVVVQQIQNEMNLF